MQLPPGTIEAFGLVLVRTSALVVSNPIFGHATTFAAAKIGLIVVLSLALYATVGAPLEPAVTPIEWGLMAAREALIGLALSFVLQAAMLAARVGGELIGQEMGFNMSSQIDPETGVSTSLVPQIYEGFFLIGLLAVDGHHLVLRALGSSLERAPVGVLSLSGGVAGMAEGLLGEMFVAGIVFALPVLVLMTLTSLFIALIARAVPQINVMEVGFTLRIAVGLVAMYVMAPLVAPGLSQLYGALEAGLDGAITWAGG